MNHLAAAQARIEFLERQLAEARAELFIARNHRCQPGAAAGYQRSAMSFPPATAPATTRPRANPIRFRVKMILSRLSRRDRQLIAGVVLGYLGFLVALAVF